MKEDSMKEFLELVLGPVSVAYYMAAEFFALLAILCSLYLHSRKRDPEAPTTPKKFSWLFLLWDNMKRVVVGQIVFFLIFRILVEWFNKELNMIYAIGVGFFLSFGLDRAIQWLKDTTNIGKLFHMNREKMIEKISQTGDKQ